MLSKAVSVLIYCLSSLLPLEDVMSRPAYQTLNIDLLTLGSEDNRLIVPKRLKPKEKLFNLNQPAQIFNSWDFSPPFCNGYLMDRDKILTSAHCFFNKKSKEKSKTEFKVQIVGSKKFFDGKVNIYPDFLFEHYIHDIAVIILDEPVPFSDVSAELLLPNENNYDLEQKYKIGYVYRSQPPIIVPMKILPKDQCKTILEERNKQSRGVICAVEIKTPNTIVPGNSGSALLVNCSGLLTPIGVLSYAEQNVPIDSKETSIIVFTNISHYDNWLKHGLNSLVKSKSLMYACKVCLMVLGSVVGLSSCLYIIYALVVYSSVSQSFLLLKPFERNYIEIATGDIEEVSGLLYEFTNIHL